MLIRTVHGPDLDSVPCSLYYERWDTLRDLFSGRSVAVKFTHSSLPEEGVELPWTKEATNAFNPRHYAAAWVQGDKVTLDFAYSPEEDFGPQPPGCRCGSTTVADCMCLMGVDLSDLA